MDASSEVNKDVTSWKLYLQCHCVSMFIIIETLFRKNVPTYTVLISVFCNWKWSDPFLCCRGIPCLWMYCYWFCLAVTQAYYMYLWPTIIIIITTGKLNCSYSLKSFLWQKYLPQLGFCYICAHCFHIRLFVDRIYLFVHSLDFTGPNAIVNNHLSLGEYGQRSWPKMTPPEA